MEQEIWKDIPGYKGLYQASNFGRIRSLDRWIKRGNHSFIRKGQILVNRLRKTGYLGVVLHHNSKGKNYLVHRLVYAAFYGPIPEGMEINHIDEDKTNNRLDNLNLVTRTENINWGTRKKRIATKLAKPVYQYTPDKVFIKKWERGARQVNEELGYDHNCICCVCRGERQTASGFFWSYKMLN